MLSKKNDYGFTLIELMIVIAIIGILAAIAIPQFSSYRVRSYNAGAVHGLRTTMLAQEAYYLDTGYYTDDIINDLDSNYGYYPDAKVPINGEYNMFDDQSYIITSYHTSGDKTYSILGPGGAIKIIE